jgi:hypothetical protein
MSLRAVFQNTHCTDAWSGRPAMTWMNEAPQHMPELRQRVQKLFPRFACISQIATGAQKEQKKATVVEVESSRVPTTLINWTGTFLAGIDETLVLLYLLRDMADRILFFDGGVVAESGPPEQIFGNPQHERTKEFVRRVVSI